MKTTLPALNRKLALRNLILQKGRGYFYFTPLSGHFDSYSVLVNRFQQLTAAEWLDEADAAAAKFAAS